MKRLVGFLNAVAPALLMAASVTLLASGLLFYGAPAGGAQLPGRPGPAGGNPTIAPSDVPESGDPGALPTPAAPSLAPTSPAPSRASASSTPRPAESADPASSPATSPSATPLPVAVATRIVIPSEGIDLPVVSRDLRVPNQGPDRYPPCDVAVYHTDFQQPGEDGSTYIYAHARNGMFLALLTASERAGGAALVGDLVQVYTDDDREYVYAITLVKRHALDFSLAENVAPGVSQLVLQTSEGPAGTVPKLQILAAPIEVLGATAAESHPRAKPRACYQTP